jgi:hypothetical protein
MAQKTSKMGLHLSRSSAKLMKMAYLSIVSLNDVEANIGWPATHTIVIIPTELYTESLAIIFYILRKFIFS